MDFQGRIGIIGAGALGGLYGARIFRSGRDVCFLMRSDYDAVRAGGLEIRSPQGDFTIHPPVFRTPGEMGLCDLLIIGLKATDHAVLPDLLGPTAGPGTVVLTLQNGLGNEEAIAEVLRRQFPGEPVESRILGGVAFLCSNRVAPGVIHHIDYGKVRLAEFRGSARERTHGIARLFEQAEFPAEADDCLLGVRWEKLVWNVPFNGLGVAAGRADSRVVLDNPSLLATATGLMREVIAAARADGVAIDTAFADRMIELTRPMGPYKSSMQIDYESGRPMEVDAIVGEPLRRAQRAGIATPLLTMLHGILSRMAEQRSSP